MFENLGEKIDKAIRLVKGRSKITDINVADTMKEIRRALLEADVSFKLAKEFTNAVKEKALGQNVLTSLQPGQLLTKIVRDELARTMGDSSVDLNLKGSPAVILMAGLQGSGKTTCTAKLAYYLKTKRSRQPLLVACDVYRPAAIDQLQTLGERIGVEVYHERENNDPVAIAKAGVSYAKSKGFSPVIIDTAGRLGVDVEMMNEISRIHKTVEPSETLFVVDAMTGQDAVNTAKAFNDVLDFDGVVLSKLDGDTRGGAALSIKATVSKPIKFIGLGEKPEALEVFHPERMADRILGMGDVVSLVEKAQEQFSEEEALKLQKKIAKNTFGFEDFLNQIQQIKKMGNFKELVGMIPGASKMMQDQIKEDPFKETEAIIRSMTPKERANPSIIDQSRKKRIAKGSGTSVEEINKLLKQFKNMGKMMRTMQDASKMKGLMRQMGNFRPQ